MRNTINNILTFLCLASLAIDACSTKEPLMRLENEFMFTAVTGQEPGTKAVLGNFNSQKLQYQTIWSEGDQIAVYSVGISKKSRFTLASGAGTTTSKFGGMLPAGAAGGSYVALYPEAFAGELSGAELSLTLPAKQVYLEGTVGNNAYPMLAVSSSSVLSFKNLCGALRIAVKGVGNVSRITVRANSSDSFLSGDATVTTLFDDAPQLVMSSSGGNEVTLDCGLTPIDTQKATDFYIVVPAQTYKGGITISVKGTAGEAEKVITSDVTIQRSMVTPVREMNVNAKYTGDAAILMDLYYATDGDNWTDNTNWGSDLPIGDWHGIKMDDNGRVTTIDLFNNNLNGHIPESIGGLSELRYLKLYNNYFDYSGSKLGGAIPESIGDLSKLYYPKFRKAACQ